MTRGPRPAAAAVDLVERRDVVPASVSRSSAPSAVAIRQSSYAPSIGARNDSQRAVAPTAMSREPSPGVMSLFIAEPGMMSCAPDRFRPPSGVASEPSAANSQTSLR